MRDSLQRSAGGSPRHLDPHPPDYNVILPPRHEAVAFLTFIESP